MHKLNPSCAIVTCPVRHDNFFYISENCEAVFGYTPKYINDRFKQLEYYFSHIHESDMDDFRDCMGYLESFLRNELPEDLNKFRTVFHYRFRNNLGHYIYLRDERATLISANGTIVHYSLIRPMPEEAVFSGAKVEIHKDGDTFEKVAEYKPSVARKLSKRENDLVVLIKKGLTTKEIAWQLNISHNTVRNIKSKLFEKYSVNNTIELLNMTA